MSVAATIALIDAALGALEVATKANQLLTAARSEGREVTDAELQAFIDENKIKREAWDNAGS